MHENNSVCAICGKGYYACLSCKDQIKLAPYKVHTDTSEHFKVYQIIRGYNIGVYDKATAKKKLMNVDLSDKDTFKDNIKACIDEIMADEETKVEVKAEVKSQPKFKPQHKAYNKQPKTDIVELTPVNKTAVKSSDTKSVNSEQ